MDILRNKPKHMRPLLYILHRLYIVRSYKDGDGFSFIFEKLNPFSWILLFLLILGTFLVEGGAGIYESYRRDKFCLGLGPYFKDHPQALTWIPR